MGRLDLRRRMRLAGGGRRAPAAPRPAGGRARAPGPRQHKELPPPWEPFPPDARLVVARVLSADGSGFTEDINRGIQWVVDHGAKVVNLSLGEADQMIVSRFGTPLRPAVEYAWSRGAIPVLASGNYEELHG